MSIEENKNKTNNLRGLRFDVINYIMEDYETNPNKWSSLVNEFHADFLQFEKWLKEQNVPFEIYSLYENAIFFHYRVLEEAILKSKFIKFEI